jgi:ethanolamine utilization microcompartment shell protein EutL
METNPNQERQQAHALLDMLPVEKLNAVRSLLEVMVDPVSRALANAPVDDEPTTEDEERAVAEAREWLKNNPGIPFEQVVTEIGLTMEEVQNYRDPP